VEVLDRYLQAVRTWLPKAQQDDIVAELSVDLRAQIEEAEAERGRPLEERELDALLQQRGHPLWVAEAYLPQQHLIGSALLPAYQRVLKIALVCQTAAFAAVYVVLGLVFEVKGVSSDLGSWVWQACLYGFATGGLITLIFARLERSQQRARAVGAWDPRRPEALPSVPADPQAERRQRRRISAAGELATSALFTLWWIGVVRLPTTPGITFSLTPVWGELYWFIIGLGLVEVALAAATLLRPDRSRLLYGISLARDSFAIVLLIRLLRSGSWMAAAVPGASPDALAGLVALADLCILITLLCILPFYLATAVRDVRGTLGKEPTRHRAVTYFAGD
jgi:hypothetical protein